MRVNMVLCKNCHTIQKSGDRCSICSIHIPHPDWMWSTIPIEEVSHWGAKTTYFHGPFVLCRMTDGTVEVGVQHSDVHHPVMLDDSVRQLISDSMPTEMLNGCNQREKCKIVIYWLRKKLAEGDIVRVDGAWIADDLTPHIY